MDEEELGAQKTTMQPAMQSAVYEGLEPETQLAFFVFQAWHHVGT